MQQIWILVQLLIILLEKYFQRTKINYFPLRESLLEKVVLKKKKKKKWDTKFEVRKHHLGRAGTLVGVFRKC